MEVPSSKYIQRYTLIEFPSFKYIPKLTSNPDDDHIPIYKEPIIAFSSHTWKESETYLYAIDLFNFGYFWEVHEVLEKIWLKLGKKSPEGIFIQGIIQLSVALLKKTQSNPVGVKRLLQKAVPKILSQNGVYLGIEVEELINEFKRFIEEVTPAPPLILLKFD